MSFLERVEKIVLSTNLKDEIVVILYGLYVHPTALEEAPKNNIVLISPYTVLLNPRNNNSM